MIAAAESDAARAIGQGEAQAARIANEAHAADPAFYQFLKSLETYRAALDSKTTLVLSADSSFLRLLTQGVTIRAAKPSNSHAQSSEPMATATPAAPLVPRSGRSMVFSGSPPARSKRPQAGPKAMSRRAALITGFVLAVTFYLATGVTAVQPDEVGIVRRFGAVQREPWEPGLHWGLPWGMDRVDRIKLNQTRTLAVGAAAATAAPLRALPILALTTFSPATSTLSPQRHSSSTAFLIRPPISSGQPRSRERSRPFPSGP